MKKILVIENEGIILFHIINLLKKNGFTPLGAADGMTGVRLSREFVPDLILCNIIMPAMNGYQVLREIRAHPITATIPVIFVTAQTTQTAIGQSQQLAADDYLTKPFTSTELLQAITRFLGQEDRDLRTDLTDPQ